ncbi:MAG: sulfotransferase [Nitrospirota bacterium]
MEKIKVLYIGGSLRSGSTLLERILGQIGDFFPVGELHNVWKAGYTGNLLCGCGKAFKDCDFWSAVTKKAFGSGMEDPGNVERAVMLQKSVSRVKKLPFLGLGKLRRNLEAYRDEYLNPLLSAIRETCGDKIVVDSSKAPAPLYLLLKTGIVDIHVVHLVRDSRAVAYSYSRKKPRPEVADRQEFMEIYSSFKVSKRWMSMNMWPLFIKRHIQPDRYMALTYESMASNPKEAIGRILDFVGVRSDLSFFLDDFTVDLRPTHSVLGNPMRFDSGAVEISYDGEWVTKLGLMDRLIVDVMTYPVMRRFYG